MTRHAVEEFGLEIPAISPIREMGAYEWLWSQRGESFKRMADRFRKDPNGLPSDYVESNLADETATKVLSMLGSKGVHRFGIRLNHAGDYPVKLRDALHPIELLYYQGFWEQSELPGLCIVGSRNPTDDGKLRAARLARELVKRDFTVVSGLATGIDSAAHKAAIDAGGRTIGVIGTPLGEYYPKENRDLQEEIAENHLLISQVPIIRYSQEPFKSKRNYFPARNATMSALTEGTIIVEAAETSGTLTQARAAIYQGRKLFILDSCFKRDDISWPLHYERLGAIRVREPEDIWSALPKKESEIGEENSSI